MRKDSLLFKWLCIILLSLASFVLPAQNSHPDTVMHDAMITPFNLSGEEINFPLGHGKPAGDINSDGYTDMIFNNWAANEQSPELEDCLPKSVIIYSSAPRSESQVFYSSRMYGIGDYNGDGYDDVVDIYQEKIKFGCPSGISEDFIQISIPQYQKVIYFSGDINDDGYSEFIIGGDTWADSLSVFSGPDTSAFYLYALNYNWAFDEDATLMYAWDFDNDDSTEFCITDWSYEDNRMILIYHFNKEERKFEIEYSGGHPFIHEPSPHYPQEFSDINGDGRMDIAHVYGAYDSTNTFRYNLEVNFGSAVPPFIDPPVEIVVGNPNRFLYHAGDFNGDGASDWYSKLNDSAVVVYYGSPDILTNGFQTVIFETGNTHYYLPLRQNYTEYSGSVTNMQTFDYDQDSIFDLYFDYWKLDGNRRYEVIGTATILGAESPDFNNPIVTGKPAHDAFPELNYGSLSTNVGDMNHDGYDDWGVLAPDNCYLDIYYGGSDWDNTPDIKYALPQTNSSLCFNWSHGDMNGDGWTDIAISNSSYHTVGGIHSMISRRNAVMIFLGKQDSQSEYYVEDADYILSDEDAFYEFGKHLSFVGDYNADGFDDLVVGGRAYYNRTAYIYFGGITINDEPDLIISRYCTQYSAHFADPITACGDINADGYADFTLADPQYERGQSLIYHGGPDADNQYDQIITTENVSGYTFGSMTVRQEGDFDGDGYPDLIHFESYNHEILVYAGGPFFDTIPDYIIRDTTFVQSWLRLDYIDMGCETETSSIGCFWTLYPSYSDTNVYDVRIYSIEDISLNRPGVVLWNRLGLTGQSYASGDFDNDGLCDIIIGVPYESNYGNPNGGVLFKYTPSLPVSTDDNQMLEEEMVYIFPNPAHSGICVRSSVFGPRSSILIYDLYGRKHDEVKLSKGQKEKRIDVSGYTAGVYIAVITSGNKIIGREKFVKY